MIKISTSARDWLKGFGFAFMMRFFYEQCFPIKAVYSLLYFFSLRFLTFPSREFQSLLIKKALKNVSGGFLLGFLKKKSLSQEEAMETNAATCQTPDGRKKKSPLTSNEQL
jgi:hypothetical protein